MRTLVFQLLQNDQQLRDLGVTADAFVASNALSSPDYDKFIVLHWNAKDPGPKEGKVHEQNLTVWVYDSGRDYLVIVAILKRIKDLLTGLSLPASHPQDSGWLQDVTWQGESDDLYDDGYQRVTRNAGYRLVGSGA